MRRLDKLVRLQQKMGWKSEASLTEIDLDENIYPLLLIMNLTGNQTFTSCGGHEDGRLKCWNGSENHKILWGGYIDFNPRSSDLYFLLRDWLKKNYKLHLDEDVWMHQKMHEVGLERDKNDRSYRISWYFNSYKKCCDFISWLEAFFIERMQEIKHEEI